MIKHINKTRMTVVSDVIAILAFLALTLFFRADSAEFNSKLFVKQAESVHLKDARVLEQYKSIADIRKEINTYIKHDSVFDIYLDEICGNVVGNTMMKLLVANMRAKNPTGSEISIRVDSGQNRFVPSQNTVYINPTLYGSDGYNVNIFCGIDQRGILVEKKLTMCDSLFHELCHAFHTYSGREKFYSELLDSVYTGKEQKYLWTDNKKEDPITFEDDEEVYNITGHCYESGKKCFDPISCNMYDICKRSSSSIVQRVFHKGWRLLFQKRMIDSTLDPLYKIDQFLIDLTQYVLTKN